MQYRLMKPSYCPVLALEPVQALLHHLELAAAVAADQEPQAAEQVMFHLRPDDPCLGPSWNPVPVAAGMVDLGPNIVDSGPGSTVKEASCPLNRLEVFVTPCWPSSPVPRQRNRATIHGDDDS